MGVTMGTSRVMWALLGLIWWPAVKELLPP